ncbi:MAG: Pyridoxamine 5-phosphate oxidase [uncultured Campylobacterales bacterium]|uniref:Pyridoxamine 5-phosphate oxidase n=1 Tax=uncultured Campylobacterales bacterium TaxID=352960 RepID=A0A6S6TGS1_9BACT|nr:MAG: Pyridoxamine 5-phosphate oxidase [uncultured Campylobacterales bacterium]
MTRITKEDAQKELQIFTKNIQSVNLSTVSIDGEPFASYSPFVEDENGNFYVFISTAVQHSHNMSANPKAHILFIEDEHKTEHIYARRRLYFKATVDRFEENDKREEKIHQLFIDRFADKVSFFSMMKDSRFYKLIPSEGNFVLGFGAAFKISDDRKILDLNDKGHSKSHEEGLKKG